MNLLEKLKKVGHLELYFSGFSPAKDQKGKYVATLQLQDPIPFVRGSREVEFNGTMRALIATNVTELKVHQDDMDDLFVFAEDNDSGFYKGDTVVLDVAERTNQVWLRKNSFATGATNFRVDQRLERLSKMFNEPIKKAADAPITGTQPANPPAETKKLVDTGEKTKK